MKVLSKTQQAANLRLLFCSCSGLIALFFFMLPAQASSFSVKPVRVELSAERPVFALQVSNNSNKAVSVQLDARSWTQENNEDIYTETNEILAVPPIFTINSGDSQTVRVGMRRAPAQDVELSYRLYLRELPAANTGPGVQMALNLGVPVFVSPQQGATEHSLQWHSTTNTDGDRLITATNRGTGHAQVTALTMEFNEQQVTRSMNTYVLPGASRHWTLPTDSAESSANALELKARVNGKQQSSLISLD